MRSCCSTYRKWSFLFCTNTSLSLNIVKPFSIVTWWEPATKKLALSSAVILHTHILGQQQKGLLLSSLLSEESWLVVFLQFYRQREAERDHNLRGRWQLPSCWNPTVSVCILAFETKSLHLHFCGSHLPFVAHWRYKNIPHMSFDDTGREPEQAFRINRDPLAELEYPTKWVTRWHFSFCAGFAASLKALLPWCKHDHGKFQVVLINFRHLSDMMLKFEPWLEGRATVSQMQSCFCFHFWYLVSLVLQAPQDAAHLGRTLVLFSFAPSWACVYFTQTQATLAVISSRPKGLHVFPTFTTSLFTSRRTLGRRTPGSTLLA